MDALASTHLSHGGTTRVGTTGFDTAGSCAVGRPAPNAVVWNQTVGRLLWPKTRHARGSD